MVARRSHSVVKLLPHSGSLADAPKSDSTTTLIFKTIRYPWALIGGSRSQIAGQPGRANRAASGGGNQATRQQAARRPQRQLGIGAPRQGFGVGPRLLLSPAPRRGLKDSCPRPQAQNSSQGTPKDPEEDPPGTGRGGGPPQTQDRPQGSLGCCSLISPRACGVYRGRVGLPQRPQRVTHTRFPLGCPPGVVWGCHVS